MTDRCDPTKRDVLKAKIKSAMANSIKDKMLRYQDEFINLLELFKKNGFTFNFKNFTFIDDAGKEYKIITLAGPTMKAYKYISDADKEQLASIGNNMTNLSSAIEPFIDDGCIEKVMERIAAACKRRGEFRQVHGNLMDELAGRYHSRMDENAAYVITTDPYDIFTKSTARTWQPTHCERIGGKHERGIDSDIANNSSVVYIVDTRKKGFDAALAMMNLRICIFDENGKTPKEKYTIGVDINWYRGEHSHKRYHIYKDAPFTPLLLTAAQATVELVEIIKSKGFKTDYEDWCTTPNPHEGYADIEGEANVNVRYRAKWTYSCKKCGTPIKRVYVTRYNGYCPWHFRNPDKE